MLYRLTTLLGLSLMLLACGEQDSRQVYYGPPVGLDAPAFHSDDDPEYLSQWGLFKVGRDLDLNPGVTAYTLASPLFSDYALKLRTVYLPEGTAAHITADGRIEFPDQTVISKTFYYGRGQGDKLTYTPVADSFDPHTGITDLHDVRLMETRLLVKRQGTWDALSYIWDADGRDAKLTRIGDIQPVTLEGTADGTQSFAYQIPNVNQCGGCHIHRGKDQGLQPIGPTAVRLAVMVGEGDRLISQLDGLPISGDPISAGDLRAVDVVSKSASATLSAQARRYLDINCAHCHNPDGPADTSGLYLDAGRELGGAYGLCKLPIAAGRGTGGRAHVIVPGDADASIMAYRMNSDAPDVMMPELGRALIHREGVELMTRWIDGLGGGCADQAALSPYGSALQSAPGN